MKTKLKTLWARIKKFDPSAYGIVNHIELVEGTIGVGCFTIIILMEIAIIPVLATQIRTGPPMPNGDFVSIAFWVFPFVEIFFVLASAVALWVFFAGVLLKAFGSTDWHNNRELVERIAKVEGETSKL